MPAKTDTRKYTACFLLDTRGYTDPVDTLIAKMRDTITAVQGEVTAVENHGQRDFQRKPSRGFGNGIFVTFAFTGPLSAPTALREKLRLDRHVNRLLVRSA